VGQWTRATGDWNGLRQRLEFAGIRFEGRYFADASQVVRGGFDRRATGRGLLGFDLTLDLAALAGLEGGTAFIGVARYQGREGSQDAGDIQAYSNIDATRFAHVYEAWYEQRLVGERIRLKLGRIDANTEFAVAEAAGGFLNASAGFSPTIYALPTYPDPAAAANLFLAPLPWLSLGAGVFQGALGDLAGYRHQADLFAIIEAGASWGAVVGLSEGRLALGRWSHAGMAPLLAGVRSTEPVAGMPSRSNGSRAQGQPTRPRHPAGAASPSTATRMTG
jgi:carbohydrate-selective porin OprB